MLTTIPRKTTLTSWPEFCSHLFYEQQIDDPVNFGAIGVVIGHELTHGFDDQGRQYDAEGNLRDWWAPEDGKGFKERTDCEVQEYGDFTVAGGEHVNGSLTLGEKYRRQWRIAGCLRGADGSPGQRVTGCAVVH